MGRRLLAGRAGSGKTRRCLELLTGALARGGPRPLLLVPTESQAEHLRTLLLDRTGGLSARTIETFASLAERVTGVRLRDLTPPAVRDRVAERALAAHFPEAAGQPGFRATFLAVVKELKELGRPLDELRERAATQFPGATRQGRLFEAAVAYAEAMPGQDHEDLLRATRDRLEREPVRLDLLLVDGFHDFTPIQLEIVRRLADGAREVVLTLPVDPDDPGNPVFATAARTLDRFREGFTIEALRGNRRAQGALADLERRLFRPPGTPLAPDGVEALSFPTDDDEADRLARLVAASGRPWRDFVLVRRSFGGLRETYRAAFARHGVPLRFFGSEPLGEVPAAHAVALWLRTLGGPVPARELLALLRSPFLLDAPPAAAVDALAKRLRTSGEPESLAEAFPALAAAIAPGAGPLRARLQKRFGVRDALVSTPDANQAIARAARLFAALDKEARAVDDLDPAEGAARLLARLPHLKGRVRDRRHDCVYAVEADEARQWEKPVALVAGLDAGSFPRPFLQDLFLRDDERKAFAEQQGVALPPRQRREDEERYLFYVALTRARERLVLSRVAWHEDGTPRAPSPYLEETLAHFPERFEREVPLAAIYPGPEAVRTRRELFPIVADGILREDPLAAALYASGAVDRAELARPIRLELARARPLHTLPADPAARLSPSRVNLFLRCPYLFFLRSVMGVEAPREHEFDPLLRGRIVHEALQIVAERGGDPGLVFDEVFARRTAALRHGLDVEAQRRWMRAAVIEAAMELAGADVERVEWAFEVPLDNGVILQGRVDRVDRTPAGPLVRDYKTGKTKLEPARALDDVQLDAYLLALDEPAGALFQRLRSRDVTGFVLPGLKRDFPSKSVEAMTPEQFADRRVRLLARLQEVARAARAGRLAVAPRDPEKCTRTRCEGFDLCRVRRGYWIAKRAAEERNAP